MDIEREIKIIYLLHHYEVWKVHLNHLIIFLGPNKYPDEISKEDLTRFRKYLYSKVDNNVYWRTLRASFNRAKEIEYIHENHFNIIKPPKKTKEQTNIYF